ncbi:hypothetical protein [Flavihumibacter solisilvae]|nr:hypothetical protein [Flavihumibacter solisilvae]
MIKSKIVYFLSYFRKSPGFLPYFLFHIEFQGMRFMANVLEAIIVTG